MRFTGQNVNNKTYFNIQAIEMFYRKEPWKNHVNKEDVLMKIGTTRELSLQGYIKRKEDTENIKLCKTYGR